MRFREDRREADGDDLGEASGGDRGGITAEGVRFGVDLGEARGMEDVEECRGGGMVGREAGEEVTDV